MGAATRALLSSCAAGGLGANLNLHSGAAAGRAAQAGRAPFHILQAYWPHTAGGPVRVCRCLDVRITVALQGLVLR